MGNAQVRLLGFIQKFQHTKIKNVFTIMLLFQKDTHVPCMHCSYKSYYHYA